MKKSITILLWMLILTYVKAQTENLCSSCLPDGILFSSQVEINQFQSTYPGCTKITGGVTIMSADITNLNGLSVLTAIDGFLSIHYNTALTNLSGLDNLITVGGTLNIESNYVLSSIAGLKKLTSVGGSGLWVGANPLLTSLAGLESLTTVNGDGDGGGYISIKDNAVLTDVSGLLGLTTMGRDLEIMYNPVLTNLTGLDNIDASTISNMYIYYNTLLTTCDVKSICDYIANPVGNISIMSNAPGCNDQTEVQTACADNSVNEIFPELDFRIYPNPSSGDIFTILTLYQVAEVNLEVYNSHGQNVAVICDESLQRGEYQHTWNTDGLPSGIYCYRLSVSSHSSSGKIVLE